MYEGQLHFVQRPTLGFFTAAFLDAFRLAFALAIPPPYLTLVRHRLREKSALLPDAPEYQREQHQD